MTTVDLPVLRTSERAVFKRCAWRWWQEYRMGYRPRGVRPDSLWFGIGIHEALAKWYLKGTRRGPHPADTFEDWYGDETLSLRTYLGEDYDEPIWEDARELGIAMLEGYVDHYGTDPQWSIIAIEQPFAITIRRKDQPIVVFESHWDGVFRNLLDGKIYLLEHKTASQVDTAYLELDDQGGSYWAVASHLLRANGTLREGEEIAGIQYNFLRKAKPDQREQNKEGHYLNKDGSVSKRQSPDMFVRPNPIERTPPEQVTQLKRIADEVAVMNAVRDGTIPLTKTPTRDCPRMCPFWGPCTLHEHGSKSYKSVLKHNFIQADPYKNYRKSAGGHNAA